MPEGTLAGGGMPGPMRGVHSTANATDAVGAGTLIDTTSVRVSAATPKRVPLIPYL